MRDVVRHKHAFDEEHQILKTRSKHRLKKRVTRGGSASMSDLSGASSSWAVDSDPSSRKTWEAGEPMPPQASLPFRVQIAARVLNINAVNNTEECFTTRFSLHLKWIDTYYQLPRAPEGKNLFVQDGQVVTRKQIVHYASHPRIGRRAVRFPDEDLGVHGVPVPCEGEPRWTPEFKLFDWVEAPEVVRTDYQVDRETGEVRLSLPHRARGEGRLLLTLQGSRPGTGTAAHRSYVARRR